jgi:hypothetical protein
VLMSLMIGLLWLLDGSAADVGHGWLYCASICTVSPTRLRPRELGGATSIGDKAGMRHYAPMVDCRACTRIG